ncbi:MAG: hypothetical protein M1819_003121 [Sarea resinae]|nr:MAG: hypothetical protein M1819_003121 [Sarea resinae]
MNPPPMQPLYEYWLTQRNSLTDQLYQSPYDILVYLSRANAYERLGYPDLAAGDAYRALLLTDEVQDESGEYHEEVTAALRGVLKSGEEGSGVYAKGDGERRVKEDGKEDGSDLSETEEEEDEEDAKDLEELQKKAQAHALDCYQILSRNLLECGSLKSAFDFSTRGLSLAPGSTSLLQTQKRIKDIHRQSLRSKGNHIGEGDSIDYTELPDRGAVRRELYPWNNYEPDRFADESLAFLNAEMEKVAPKCEVRATLLPVLTSGVETEQNREQKQILQLGMFAKADIAPGEIFFSERSLLTATTRVDDPICDACAATLPDLKNASGRSTVTACAACTDTIFCTPECHDLAQATYHPATCGSEASPLPTPLPTPQPAHTPKMKDTSDMLYLLLLSRALAIASTTSVHPLEIKEVKYIWGDFLPSDIAIVKPTLPFSFENSIANPLHLLTTLHDRNIFTSLRETDTWISQTLYAKFRGTASARFSMSTPSSSSSSSSDSNAKPTTPTADPKCNPSTLNPATKEVDGRGIKLVRPPAGPDVASVHPLWCLANHSCTPNVAWEWGGVMKYWARDRAVPIFAPAGAAPPVGGGGAASAAATAAVTSVDEPASSANGRPTAPPYPHDDDDDHHLGISAGDEILNHYTDISLPVRQRREWAAGALGGWCMCHRCRVEAGEIVD